MARRLQYLRHAVYLGSDDSARPASTPVPAQTSVVLPEAPEVTPRTQTMRWLYGLGMSRQQIASYLRLSRSVVNDTLDHSGGTASIRPPLDYYERRGRAAVKARR